MAARAAKNGPVDLLNGKPPPLESGDRLSRDEFERRYEAMPHLKKAELIEGVVYVPSPIRVRQHGQPNRHMSTWMGNYEAVTPGVLGGDNTTARLDLANEPQPDLLLLVEPAHGGQALITEDDYIEGAPELIAEIAASSASMDLGTKLQVYRRAGVREYIVWRVLDQQVDWFVLRGRQYRPLKPNTNGLLCSKVFPGLWLDPAALVRGDLVKVLAVVQQGTATPEHAAFVTRLSTARP